MSKCELNEIIMWAVKLADEHQVGIQGVISSFISANNELKNVDKAKAFVENETKGIRRVKEWMACVE